MRLLSSLIFSAGLGASIANAAPLHLHTGTIDSKQLAAKASIQQPSLFGIVQFADKHMPDAEWLKQQGLSVLSYLPENAFLVKFNHVNRQQLAQSKRIGFVGSWSSDLKIAPTAKSAAQADYSRFNIVGFPGESLDNLRKAVLKAYPSLKILRAEGGKMPVLEVEAKDLSTLQALATPEWVQVIQVSTPMQWHNTNTVSIIQSNTVSGNVLPTNTPIWDQDLLGTGEIIGIADSGLDRNEDWFRYYDDGTGITDAFTDAEATTPPELGQTYPDRKIFAYWVMPGAAAYDAEGSCGEDNFSAFHGTHVAGTAAGDRYPPATPTFPNFSQNEGMAPNAQILFQDLGEENNGCLVGQGGTPMFYQAYLAGARLHSNSYGSSNTFNYVAREQLIDWMLWELQDYSIFHSAGNAGPDFRTVGHPALAKNVVAVGASGSNNSTEVADFSSRGPAPDLRVKPDIVAPGVAISSARGNDDDDVPPLVNTTTTWLKSGTSMSTPAVAGGAALMRQYYRNGFYPSGERKSEDAMSPTAALMKATLLNGTQFLGPQPNRNTGWGKIYLDNNLYFSGDSRELRVWDVRHAYGLKTGDVFERQVEVVPGEEFRVNVVWTDVPGSVGTNKALVNDLDLEVEFNGQSYVGNRFEDGESVPGGVRDAVNNVEGIRFASPTSGIATIRVKGENVPGFGEPGSNRQGFALVTSGASCNSSANVAPTVSAAANEDVVDVDFGRLRGDNREVFRARGSCDAPAADFHWVGATSGGSFQDLTTIGGYTYAYRARNADACGESVLSDCVSVVSEAACTLEPDFSASSLTVQPMLGGDCGAKLNWSAGASECPDASLRYKIYRSEDPDFVPGADNLVATVSNTAYTDSTVEPMTQYYYAVRAQNRFSDGTMGAESSQTTTRAVAIYDLEDGENFKDTADDLYLATIGEGWTRSTREAFSGDYSYNSTPTGQSYVSNSCTEIRTPEIKLGSNSRLKYQAQYQIEEYWDGVIVEISIDGGNTWADLKPNGGYPSDLRETEIDGVPINACGYPASQGAFNGVTADFTEYKSNLSNYAGEDAIIRWRFTSDPATESTGFFLDDIVITGSQGVTECSAVQQNLSISELMNGAWSVTSDETNDEGPGRGLSLQIADSNGSKLAAVVYGDFKDSKPVWSLGTALVDDDGTQSIPLTWYTGAQFPPAPAYSTDDVIATPYANATLSFTDQNSGKIVFDVIAEDVDDFEADLTRITQYADLDGLYGCKSGGYVDEVSLNADSQGFALEVLDVMGDEVLSVGWYSFLNGEAIYFIGAAPIDENGIAVVNLNSYAGAKNGADFDADDVVVTEAGTITVDLMAQAGVHIDFVASDPRLNDYSDDLFRIIKPDGANCPL